MAKNENGILHSTRRNSVVGPSTKSSDVVSGAAFQHRIVFPKKKQEKRPQQKVGEEYHEDPIGDSISNILNSHPDFRYDPVRIAKLKASTNQHHAHENEFTFTPLLCQRNWLFLQHKARCLKTVRLPTILLSIAGFCYEQLPTRETIYARWNSSLLLFFSMLALGLFFLAIPAHIVTVWLGREAFLLSVQLLMILVDWKDVQESCPSVLKSLVNQMIAVAKMTNRFVFMGKRFAGREWNKDDFEFENLMSAQSRHSQLWSLPPPCIQEAGNKLCLDSRYMTRDEWGQETSRHVIAINYSYIMMREENTRKLRTSRAPVAKHHHHLAGGSDHLTNERKESSSGFDLHLSSVAANRRELILGLSSKSSLEGIELVHDEEQNDAEGDLQSRSSNPLAAFTNDMDLANDPSIMLAPTPMNDKSGYDSSESSVVSCSSAAFADMNWVDISAKIGMRVLNSAHLQQVVASQETAERLKNITEQFVVSPRDGGRQRQQPFDFISVGDTQDGGGSGADALPPELHASLNVIKSPSKPVHSMWTSAAAAGVTSDDEKSIISPSDLERPPSEACRSPSAFSVQRSFSFSQQRRECATPMTPLRQARESETPTSSSPSMASLKTRYAASYDSANCEVVYESEGTEEDIHARKAIRRVRDIGESKELSQQDMSRRSSLKENRRYRRSPLTAGVKVAAPICPLQPGGKKVGHTNYQMATVVSSRRIFINTLCEQEEPLSVTSEDATDDITNCLSVTCKIDRSFLRNGDFAELTFRVMDDWGPRYMPKHSKVPIGSCVATSYGVGVVVGWRVEDDCHVIRSLWQRRGPGAAHAYLNRDAIHSVLEAAVGFDVETKVGSAKVIAYVDSGADFRNGRYIVSLQDDCDYKDCIVALKREDVHSCHGAQFMPVIEHIREACQYQILLDNYKAVVRRQKFSDQKKHRADDHIWKFWSESFDTLWQSFLLAVQEDSEFDEGVDKFMSSIIDFLEHLDCPPEPKDAPIPKKKHSDCSIPSTASLPSDFDDLSSTASSTVDTIGPVTPEEERMPGFWILNDILGGIFQTHGGEIETVTSAIEPKDTATNRLPISPSAGMQPEDSESYRRAFAVIRTLMKTVSYARAASVGKPRFRLAMTVARELLQFCRTLIKVQQKNVSKESLCVWQKGIEEIKTTFGPIKERLEKIGRGIAQRMEQQGRKAKIKALRFVDSILQDELFLNAACHGEWEQCLLRIESCMVKSKIIDEASCGHYRKTARFLYDHLVLFSSTESSAAARNNEKLAHLASLVQFFASPKRSTLKVLRSDKVLDIIERILIRVFCRERNASRTLTILASNFKSLRHLRVLKDLSVAGRLWIPLLDAADEELSYIVSRMPESAKEFMCPLSSMFSLCVAQFHKISAGCLTSDWLDFLMEEDGVRIIHDIDMKLILALSSFSRDIKETIEILPYYPSIDDDILNLMDEVKIDIFLKEASDAIDDPGKLAEFIQEKASVAIERFLAYLPKLSVPVERRDLGDGWVLSCYGQDGGDLTLSDVKVKRKNLMCEVMGRDALFLPFFDATDDTEQSVASSIASVAYGYASKAAGYCPEEKTTRVEESILDHIREMIVQAHRHGSWTAGIGGVGQICTDQYMASALSLPITSVLNCAIELWRNLEIDDDELLEIAIRDVSYQIQLHKEMEEVKKEERDEQLNELYGSRSSQNGLNSSASKSGSFEDARERFNPRVDPTVIYLEMKNLTLHLEQFRFRIEKDEKRTVFDPVFEGCGTVSIENVGILLRVECARERVGNAGTNLITPALILRELEVDIENVNLKVQDTGADWLLNKAVKGFAEQITQVVALNLKEQIEVQTKKAIEQLNSYFLVNPDILLNILGITMDDLEDHVVWV